MADQLLSRLEAAVARLETLAGVSQTSVDAEPFWIKTFEDEYVKKVLVEFSNSAIATNQSEIALVSNVFIRINEILLELIRKSQKTPKPANSAELQEFMVSANALARDLKPDNRSDFFSNQKAIAEALSIVLILSSSAPASHLQSVLEAVDFHLIKVLRKKVEAETLWAKQLKICIQWLFNWATEHIKMGIIWNTKPTALPGAKAKAPGPPPPPPVAMAAAPASTVPSGGFGNVLKQLEGGSFNLKKTEKGAKSAYTEVAAVPMDIEKPAAKRPFVGRQCAPKILLERDCWYIEGQYECQEPVRVTETNMKQSVYVGKSANATIIVSGKVKTITVDNCEKINLVVESVISTIEIVNCKKVNLQITGLVPSVSIDKTDGVQLYLCEASVNLDLTTAKCSEINLNMPTGDGDWKELVVPEQFVHKISGNKVVSRVSDLYG